MGTNVAPVSTPILQFFNNAGQLNVGGSLLTQVGGVNYPTYQDAAGTTALPNPIPLNSRGEISNTSGVSVPLYLIPSVTYTFTLYDANNNVIWVDSNVIAQGAAVVGQMTDELGSDGSPGFKAGTDFTPGVTTSLTLSGFYGSAANLWVAFDGAEQGSDTYSLSGETLTFSSPIPTGTNKVFVKGGTALTIGTPADGTVGNSQLSWGNILNRVVDSIAALKALGVSTYTRAFVTGYYAAGDGGGGPYSYSASTSQSLANDGTIVAASGGVGCWILQSNGPISVKQFGAKGDNTNDDGPPIQACIAACDDVYIPDGTYLFNSTSASPIPATDPQNVLIEGRNNFRVTASRGSSFICSNSANDSCMFTVYNCQNFKLSGFTLTGNRTGISSGTETVAINLASVVDFEVEDIHVAGNWGDAGTMFGGDWWVNGRIRKVRGDQVGTGFDIAFYTGCVFEDIEAVGYNISTAGAGNIGLSTVYDVPNENANMTGVSFSNTDRNYFRNVRMRNFNAGVYLTTGTNYFFDSSCDFSSNPGSGSAPGYGITISYENGGSFTSVGNPVGNVYFDGTKIRGNGATVAGGGVLIDGNAITNSDVLSSIYFRGCDIDNNNNVGVNSVGESHFSVIVIDGCNFSGGAQTTPVSSGLLQSLVSSASPGNGRVENNAGLNPTGFFGVTLPGGTGSGNTVTNTRSYPAKVYIYTQASAYIPNIVQPGGTVITLGTVAANSAPCVIDLPPGYGIYFTTAVPASWEWMGL